MYKSILVAIDLSQPEPSQKIVSIARSIAGADGRIALLHVLPEIPAFVAPELPEGMLQKNVENAREELQALAGDSGAKVEVRYGHPSTTIFEFAEETGADLIIVGSHRPGFQDYFLGSTAARVVRHAQCAVLVDR